MEMNEAYKEKNEMSFSQLIRIFTSIVRCTQIKSCLIPIGGRVRSDWKLQELIYAYARMFEYYADLKEYADCKGLKVYNASEYSWINCF